MKSKLPTITHSYQNHHLDSTRWGNFRPRPDDIVIATSYKSGTTWMQGIVRQLVFLNQHIPPLDDLSPWLDRRGNPLRQVFADLNAQTHRRFIKTHLSLDGIKFFPQMKYLVVGRDTRDVFMSLWNHYSHYTPEQYTRLNDTPGRVGKRLPQCPDDIHEFWTNWISRGWFPWESEGYPFWGNLHHTATWWQYRQLDNILLVHFGDLLTNLPVEIERIAAFLGIPVTSQDLERIAQAVTIENMRAEAQATDAGLVKSFRGGAGTFFFKGVNGRWKDILTPAELDLYHAALKRNLTPAAIDWLTQGRSALS